VTVHNHGSEEGAGLACNESRLPDGSLIGACLLFDDVIQGKRSVNDVRRIMGMSSSFYVLCMSHDPATQICELRQDSDMRNALTMGVVGHMKCDTVLMRVSGAPVEFGCPGIRNSQCRGHREIEWIDADVLRLLYYVRDDQRIAVETLYHKSAFRCWTAGDRLNRLRFELAIEGD
jgi:hypothetical protein